MNELEFAYDATIEGWVRALGLKDKHTEGHSVRLAQLAMALAHELGIQGEDLIRLRRGALLHDIGKLGIPDAILNKVASLTEAEWEMMRLHTEYGLQVLGPIHFLQPAAEIAYCHHENWDGSGYPRGLKGENIPLRARVVSICNVYDALVSDQPYRKGWEKKNALRYVGEASGKQFDPEVVVAFMRLFRDEH